MVHVISLSACCKFTPSLNMLRGVRYQEPQQVKCIYDADVLLQSYPACDLNEQSFNYSTVFTRSLLAVLQEDVFQNASGLHNLYTQALVDAPVCTGHWPLVLLTPPVGGQRQVYTQYASELASKGTIVATIDHPLLSGAVELESGDFLFNAAGQMITHGEDIGIMAADALFVAARLTYEQRSLPPKVFHPGTCIEPRGVCVFGHGAGGNAAELLASEYSGMCGRSLDGRFELPSPFREKDVFRSKEDDEAPEEPQPPAESVDNFLFDKLEAMMKAIQKLLLKKSSLMLCRIVGACDTPSEDGD